MNFGVPNQRRKREEQFPNASILTLDIDGGKGTSRAMLLNSKAVETLGLDELSSIFFGFEEDVICIGNAAQAGVPSDIAIKVTKGSPRKVSDKRTYEYIGGLLELDNAVQNHFQLEEFASEDGQPNMFKLVSYVEDNSEVQADTTASFGEAATITEGVSEETGNATY